MKKGQKMPEHLKENLRQLKLGKKLSPSHREKVIQTLHFGKKYSGENHPSWKGGRIISDEGYVLIRMKDHPNARSNGYFPEHRLIMESIIGRFLLREEVVHHKNGIKIDNRPENLELFSHSQHANIHWNNEEAKKRQSEFMRKIRKQKFWSTRKH